MVAAVVVMASAAAQSASIDLGTADPLAWSLLSVGGSTVTVNNESIVRDFDENGNPDPNTRAIGIQGAGKLQMSGNGLVYGKALLGDGSNLGITDDNSVLGGIFGASLSGDPKNNPVTAISQNGILDQAAADAVARSDFYRSLTASASFGTLNSPQTLVAGAGLNVISLDKLELGGDEVLTLDGNNLDSSFVLNVSGDLKLNSGRVELTGGLTFDEVLFNVGGKVAFSGGGNASVLSGIIVALNNDISLSPGLVKGTLIGKKITLTSGADLDTPDVSQIPLPAALPLMLSGFAVIGALGMFRRRRRAHALEHPA